jgi:hypothetical protein
MRQTLGDVMKVNGFSRYAVIDDRGDHVKSVSIEHERPPIGFHRQRPPRG